jgi:hypothetical protein
MNNRAHRLILGAGVGVVLAGAVAFAAEAHNPTSGSRKYAADYQLLLYDFSGSYPSWVTSASDEALQVNYQDPGTNNSRAPLFGYTSGGAGDVIYDGYSSSPCGTGNLDWIQCANGGGTTSWNIYIRDFDEAPYSNFKWWDKTSSCPSGTCFYLRRGVIHEILHITLAAGHNSDIQTNTIMQAATPAYAKAGWNQIYIRKCDTVRHQLSYDVEDFYGPYGDCFDHITNHGPTGLQSNLTVSQAPTYFACNGVGVNVTGRLQVSAFSSYGLLSGNPLAGRTVWFDRNGVGNWASTVANANSGNNYSFTVFGPSYVTHNYVAHFNATTNDGLDSSNQVSFSITWDACFS